MKRLRWTRVAVTERGKDYVDHVAVPFRVAKGYDEAERRAGRPWTLFERGTMRGTFATSGDAKAAAVAPSTTEIPARVRRSTAA